MVALLWADAPVDLLQDIAQELEASEAGGQKLPMGVRKAEHVEGNAVRTDNARTNRIDEIGLGVVMLVIEDQELRRVAAIGRRKARELVDQRLRQLRLASSEVDDDADVQLVQVGVAGVQVVRSPFSGDETLANLEPHAQVPVLVL